MIWDGFNKRKFPRLNLQCEIEIQTEVKPDASIHAVTENVGIGGVCVVVDKSLERFSRCHLRLELDAQSPMIECHGKVVWAVPTRDIHSHKTLYDTNIEFLDIPSESRDLLKNRLEDMVKKSAPKKGC